MRNGCGFLMVVLFALRMAPGTWAADDRKFRIEFEAGPVWQTRNDARIPNATGTKFSLRDIQGTGPFAAGRVYVDYAFKPKHELSFLAAPLSLTSSGDLRIPVSFAGKSFAAGPGIQATYQFNSYRMTYRYRVFDGERWTWKIGITGKIRDAKIELRDASSTAVDKNLGFVPLLHLDGEYRFTDRWRFHMNMDGLAATQGRAFDVSFKVKHDLSKNWTVAAGYRMLEGGADVEKVYAFGWLHYATASIAFRF